MNDLRVSYEGIGDVLYIGFGRHLRTKAEEAEAGLYLRRDSDTNLPAGATVVDYKEYWTPKRDHLANRLSEFLGLTKAQIEQAMHEAERP